jgi:hypothetical protein
LYSAATGAYSAQHLTGRVLARAPEWVGSAGFDYKTPVWQDKTLVFGGTVTYTSWFYTNLTEQPNFIQGGFAKANASLALRGPDDKWEVALIGNNITAKITGAVCANANINGGLIFGGQQSGKATGGPAGNDYEVCPTDPGRAVWLRGTVRVK